MMKKLSKNHDIGKEVQRPTAATPNVTVKIQPPDASPRSTSISETQNTIPDEKLKKMKSPRVMQSNLGPVMWKLNNQDHLVV